MAIDFDLHKALRENLGDAQAIVTPEAHAILQACEDESDAIDDAVVSEALDPIIDSVAANPESLSEPSTFDSLQLLLKFSARISSQSLSQVFDLLISGLSAEGSLIHAEVESSDENAAVDHQRTILEMYAFLLQWAFTAVQTKAAESVSAARGRVTGKGAKVKSSKSSDMTTQLKTSMETMCKIMKIKLARIFVTTSERDTFIGMFTRSVYLLLENEQCVKDQAVRMHVFKVICVAVKHHGHAFGAQTSIVQNLSYYEHLAEPMAELLHILAEQYDYPQLTEEILRLVCIDDIC